VTHHRLGRLHLGLGFDFGLCLLDVLDGKLKPVN
jgi:hypothetical protein